MSEASDCGAFIRLPAARPPMDTGRLAAYLGIVAALATALLAFLPYAVLDPTALGPYFAVAPVGPPAVGLLALVAVVVLAAGLTGRSDPTTMAGAALVLGLFMAVLAWWWALSVTPSLVGGLTSADWFGNHRWALALAATLLLVTAGGYARAVL